MTECRLAWRDGVGEPQEAHGRTMNRLRRAADFGNENEGYGSHWVEVRYGEHWRLVYPPPSAPEPQP